jgi:hypothetical protein
VFLFRPSRASSTCGVRQVMSNGGKGAIRSFGLSKNEPERSMGILRYLASTLRVSRRGITCQGVSMLLIPGFLPFSNGCMAAGFLPRRSNTCTSYSMITAQSPLTSGCSIQRLILYLYLSGRRRKGRGSDSDIDLDLDT